MQDETDKVSEGHLDDRLGTKKAAASRNQARNSDLKNSDDQKIMLRLQQLVDGRSATGDGHKSRSAIGRRTDVNQSFGLLRLRRTNRL